MEADEVKRLIIEAIEEYVPIKAVDIPGKWKEGKLILQPEEGQAKEVPIEVFLKKLTSVRDSLRVLEQKINGHASLSPEDKATFQAYLTKCYGSLTTFNVLFKNQGDRFIGSGKARTPQESKEKMTILKAKARLGLNEY